MNNFGGTSSGGGAFASFFLQGVGIGTTVTVLIDSAVFVTGRFEGVQNGIALFRVKGVPGLIRIPLNQIIALSA